MKKTVFCPLRLRQIFLPPTKQGEIFLAPPLKRHLNVSDPNIDLHGGVFVNNEASLNSTKYKDFDMKYCKGISNKEENFKR